VRHFFRADGVAMLMPNAAVPSRTMASASRNTAARPRRWISSMKNTRTPSCSSRAASSGSKLRTPTMQTWRGQSTPAARP
jgi:hypothetical protein